MTPAELLIVYLAAGAPFGVYAFFNQVGRPGYLNIVGPVLKFAFWPVFASQLIIQHLSGRFGAQVTPFSSSRLIEETESLRRDITSTIAFENSHEHRHLLDEFERFAGITAAVYEAERNGKPSTPIILEAGGHPSPNLGAKCIFRRNRARLLEHRNRAFEGFVADLGKASTNGGPFTIEDLIERARSLATAGESKV